MSTTNTPTYFAVILLAVAAALGCPASVILVVAGPHGLASGLSSFCRKALVSLFPYCLVSSLMCFPCSSVPFWFRTATSLS